MAEAAVSKARSPLTETTNRINSPIPAHDQRTGKSRHHDRSETHQVRHGQQAAQASTSESRGASAGRHTAPESHRPNVSSPPHQTDDAKRFSQASYASTSSSRSKKNYKTHIGPWQLGRTLGKGSSARVRLCRHNITNQLAAVKIVNRRMAYLVKDSSLAALSKWDSNLPEKSEGEMRVPMAIEREVAILKLIEHPNIMKLYDIWENRSEIYLILEYIDQGDLFTFINTHGRLTEEVSVYFFRQIISAITYCHSFNVCHRDLKPENILITADLQIKIADFGMAALHQTATHQLATACGSPHYAAPELLKNRQYRGDRADIWSLGVILYAMLSATLPFDDPDLRIMMAKTKKGHYEMPKFLSPEAEDLIRRMLQTNPDRRITLKEIWRHPLVQKYSYPAEFGDNSGQLPDIRKGFQHTPVTPKDIDPQLLRQLRSMWHMFSERDLSLKLSSEEPNDQKAFYWLLHNYRDKQLEDFKPELAHSMSDYHHLKPAVWKKRVSTCQFAQPRVNGHGRSVSRFTVISNAAETEAGTVKSYDPYRGSRMLQSSNSHVSHAKVIVHRDEAGNAAVARNVSNTRRGRANSTVRTVNSGRPQSSRGSMTSLRSSRQGAPLGHAPSLRHKRGVDFTHVRRSTSRNQPTTGRGGPPNTLGGVSTRRKETHRGMTPDLPRMPDGSYPKAKGGPPVRITRKDASVIFNEELRKFSNNIAKDCDEAFKSSLIGKKAVEDGSSRRGDKNNRQDSPLSFTLDGSARGDNSTKPWDTRPLPPLPANDPLSRTSTAVDSRPTSSDDDSITLGEQVSQLALPVLISKLVDRRIVSAPAYGQTNRKASALPSIHENGGISTVTYGQARIVSAPPHSASRRANELNNSMELLSKIETTIRVVDSSGASGPRKAPRPLNVLKKKGGVTEDIGRVIHRQLAYNAEAYDENLNTTSALGARDSLKKKRPSWFKRSSKSGAEMETVGTESTVESTSAAPHVGQQTEPPAAGGAPKRRSFPFWKSNRSRDLKMSVEEPDNVNDGKQVVEITAEKKTPNVGLQESESGGNRNIEVKQNWLTRLFRVKPATSYVCMTMSRRRARQEIATILRFWRRYGIRGIQVDKQRNIIFARIGARNYLNLKEVAFAVEIMTVIEHGKKQPLSIIRFTQELGAASSFHRLVDTMRIVLTRRGLLVTDRNKQRMMIKTLNA